MKAHLYLCKHKNLTMIFKKTFTFALLLLALTSAAQVHNGKASYYADKFEGRLTASGAKYKHSKLTAAHRLLPFGTKVKVTNLSNDKTVIVEINDRGPFVDGRIIDLSKSAAEKLDFVHAGIAEVSIEVIDHGDGKGGGQVRPGHHNEVEEKEFYTMQVDRLNPKGFGVQIGSFKEMTNLVRLTQNLKSSYHKQVAIQVKVINNNKVYTIILGQFPSRAKADSFKIKLKKRFPDAFVISYNKL
jgi:rare lipoprotein A